MQRADFRGGYFLRVPDFSSAVFDDEARFDDFEILPGANFQNTRISTLFLSASSTESVLGLTVPPPTTHRDRPDNGLPVTPRFDFRGAVVNRVHADWREIVRLQEPFDRQPYAQFEQSYRQIGDDAAANDIYFRHRDEQLRNRHHDRANWSWLRIGWNYFIKFVSGFGVRPIRLIVAAMVVVIGGACIYMLPGAVESEPSNLLSQPRIAQVSLLQAVQVSVDQVLPLEVPGTKGLGPSQTVVWPWPKVTFRDLASLQAIFGWILVPVTLAAIVQALIKEKVSLPE
jgi:hypothetical protein